jgi:hypothetical protein
MKKRVFIILPFFIILVLALPLNLAAQVLHDIHIPQVMVYRAYSGKSKLRIYETRSVSESGSYKLGITASKKLVVYSEGKKGNRKTVWRSN